MLSLHGVSAWIEVDGKELDQYGVEELPDKATATCWIPTQVDKNFTIVFRDDEPHRTHSLSSYLQFDGSSTVFGRIIRPSNLRRTAFQNNDAVTTTSARPFIFSNLELTDDDEYLNQASPHLGEIQIQIFRCEALERGLFLPGLAARAHGKIHERSKKAVTHCVSYGEETRTVEQYSYSVIKLDGNRPLVTFIFKYRDSKLLQANGIIPMQPSAKQKQNAIVSEDVLDLTTDDVQTEPGGEAIKVNATQTKAARPNKRRGSEVKPVKKIKRERIHVPTGEVIDLT